MTREPWGCERSGTPYTQGVGNKRRVWWIVGAIALAVALFAAVAFFIGYNGTDAKIERAMARIVEEYGFEFQEQVPGYFHPGSGESYSRTPVSAEMASEIVAILREALPSCEYRHFVYDEDDARVTRSGGDPWREAHQFAPTEQLRGRTEVLVFVPDDKGRIGHQDEPHAYIDAYKSDRPDLWQRIKGLWPW